MPFPIGGGGAWPTVRGSLVTLMPGRSTSAAQMANVAHQRSRVKRCTQQLLREAPVERDRAKLRLGSYRGRVSTEAVDEKRGAARERTLGRAAELSVEHASDSHKPSSDRTCELHLEQLRLVNARRSLQELCVV